LGSGTVYEMSQFDPQKVGHRVGLTSEGAEGAIR